MGTGAAHEVGIVDGVDVVDGLDESGKGVLLSVTFGSGENSSRSPLERNGGVPV